MKIKRQLILIALFHAICTYPLVHAALPLFGVQILSIMLIGSEDFTIIWGLTGLFMTAGQIMIIKSVFTNDLNKAAMLGLYGIVVLLAAWIIFLFDGKFSWPITFISSCPFFATTLWYWANYKKTLNQQQETN